MSASDSQLVVVARFHPTMNAFDADIAVSKLEAAGIPAARFPTNVIAGAPMGLVGPEPVRVMVTADRAQEAREILAQEGQ